ncbi:slr1658 superfamily regulator [Rhizobium sp. ZW T2_16]|uniref:slr1658 superfamily regulator n=1 Tax=Rhizobium sp. ZW T2_16 TaxID=3378083 RepID=UPI000FA1D547
MSKTILGIYDLTEARFLSGASLTLIDGPLELGWRHSGLTSDFIADAMALPFSASKTLHADIHHSIGYLSNELIENAVKFRQPGKIMIEACVIAGVFLMRVSNDIDIETSQRFQDILTKILAADPSELLIGQIEANAASDATGSGLGLLTLLADYDARMSWEFEPLGGDRIKLTTTASLTLPLASNG